MGRGNSYGGGHSSLGYLFGSGEAPTNSQNATKQEPEAPQKTTAAPSPVNKDIPAGVAGNLKNNYFRADGQNCGNFLTVIPFKFELFLSRFPGLLGLLIFTEIYKNIHLFKP